MIYKNEQLKEISFPIGGIGTGSIGLAGNGALIDWEIRNRPNKGSTNMFSFFAVKAQYPDGKTVLKVMQGDQTGELMGHYAKARYCGFGYGPFNWTMCSFPHFKSVKFDGKFPIATLTFEDESFPAQVVLTAFNPFIPLDADNSSIPSAFFKIRINSRVDGVKYSVVFSVSNPFGCGKNKKLESEFYTAVMLKSADKAEIEIDYGDLTVATDHRDCMYQEYWYRGQWKDNISTFWNELLEGQLQNRHYDEVKKITDVCSVGASGVIDNGCCDDFRFVLSWNVPNNYNYWDPYKDADGNDVIWKNYYATLFVNSSESAFYSLEHFEELFRRTNAFCKSLHQSTLDKDVIDAISSTISVLKSPTVLRLEDGTFYGWEGVHEKEGSCEGTCTHVWSYAYALCFLFPELERSLRDTELTYNTFPNGGMNFRTKLPRKRDKGNLWPCLDGQMATVIKIYRDWKITGNTEWLREHWEEVKSVLEYAWSEQNWFGWDRDRDGVLEGSQHHTLDMNLFGPSSWLEGMYLAALKAAGEMAEYLGDKHKKEEYEELYQSGYEWTKENLFNGEYFYHKIDLTNKEYVERYNCPDYWNEEKGQLKYQIGNGSEIDQMLGQWHANICGLGDIFDKEQRKIALQSMMKNNFKPSLREFTNMWRVFALNDEAGTVICDYPEGKEKPIIPVPYCEECMTGFEYAFAGLLISEGFIDDGLKVVHAIRDRYDGEKRNPWNEMECGSNYARAMASFALLPIFSGFTFDLPNHFIGFSPITDGDFRCLWSLGTGWGDYIKNKKYHKLIIKDGDLILSSIRIGSLNNAETVSVDGKEIPFKINDGVISFDEIIIRKELVVKI
ncbi:MAG: GH116 family glycosyl hydrolase [Acutalibacteraceae bacterium]|nr:GH116 family glycosyl hydrolase [Acutalibacteraceae bacterium]